MVVNPELAIPGGLRSSPYNLLKERKKRQWNLALNRLSVVLKSETTEVWFKTGNRTALWSSNPTAGHTHWGNQKGKRHVYPNVHHSTVCNSQDMEAT